MESEDRKEYFKKRKELIEANKKYSEKLPYLKISEVNEELKKHRNQLEKLYSSNEKMIFKRLEIQMLKKRIEEIERVRGWKYNLKTKYLKENEWYRRQYNELRKEYPEYDPLDKIGLDQLPKHLWEK